MLEAPFFKNFSRRSYDIILLGCVTLMYVTICAEADMYVPVFPAMIKYFGVEECKIQLVLSLNFGGLCISGLVVGPLSDCYGRRKVLVGGLFLFFLSSIGCVVENNFNLLLVWRVLQGVAAAAPMVIGGAIFIDKYPTEKAGQLVCVMNSVISASMAGAPLMGAWISGFFNWRANFIIILILGSILFIGTLLFVEETLPQNKRKKLCPMGILRNYGKLFKSLEFMSYTLIVNFPFTAIVVYIANLSVIFINHIGMNLTEFSYYQATTMGTFIVFSLFSIKLISKKGLNYTKNFGGMLALIGSLGMMYISQSEPINVNIISLSMALIAAGGAMMAGTFGIKALSVFPEINGTSMAMMVAIRQFLAFGLVIVSELFFDGTIIPVADIIFGYAVVAMVCYGVIQHKEQRRLIKKI